MFIYFGELLTVVGVSERLVCQFNETDKKPSQNNISSLNKNVEINTNYKTHTKRSCMEFAEKEENTTTHTGGLLEPTLEKTNKEEI